MNNAMMLAGLLGVVTPLAHAGEKDLNGDIMDRLHGAFSHVRQGIAAREEARAQVEMTRGAIESTKRALGSGVFLDGEPSPAIAAALLGGRSRSLPLPADVELTVMSSEKWGDNPQIAIRLDGFNVYREYLYHSEQNLALIRRSPLKPWTWRFPQGPSPDFSKRFEAALSLAREGTVRLRERMSRH